MNPAVDPPPATPRSSPVRVLVVDDQAVVRRGLATMVAETADLEVVAEAPDGERAVVEAAARRPDVVLMDVRMPGIGGIEAARRIVTDHAGAIKVLMVTTFDLDAYVFDSLRAGASGFVLKDLEPEELAHAIRVVQAGESLLTPSATRRLVAEFVRGPAPGSSGYADGGVTTAARRTGGVPAAPELSAREQEVVIAVARGLSNAEIAATLHLARTTVKSHISSALTKWGLRDRTQLVVRAFESGLVVPDP